MNANSLQTYPVILAKADGFQAASDEVSTEVPVALVYNGIAHVVLMATPEHLSELALGFSLSEGIIDQVSQVYDIDTASDPNGLVVNLEIATASFQRLKGRRRNMSGRTGCGLCGLDSLAAVLPDIQPVQQRQSLAQSAIVGALAHFDEGQVLRARTGSVHGVAWANSAGQIQATFEDVGRHNALDKMIGWGLRAGLDWQNGFVLLSSRASFEMVVKAAAAGIGCVVAVSAPTAYAIDLANQANITLVGFARSQRQVIYTHSDYLRHE
ncbi:formate dehydrogenase accessory sulfurtransferase FdhD [Snodgrassella sp. CFCC 13594]|uniref:formate dehydrogenase accessory sulfurtransferase FdhD n=1 Tax=Snodgrassella sp. CFCC 13594 TaxID=1775559 RepID=UPI0009EDDC64|nr:formate dehydrogenase accessory sulfurtransferase FdhD [Snodgrassella sp. CFCC 13594]